ncbi:unnamed protein product [Protopolystoma xenopodis]|uniref:Uncharacterized protein n=1 Tax=Protopolystoma xenopodis TaxID=117903 RepID=A0A3S4ZY29_9PLAT|nr:unnamed protein product [Protopolystoma xenopodis]
MTKYSIIRPGANQPKFQQSDPPQLQQDKEPPSQLERVHCSSWPLESWSRSAWSTASLLALAGQLFSQIGQIRKEARELLVQYDAEQQIFFRLLQDELKTKRRKRVLNGRNTLDDLFEASSNEPSQDPPLLFVYGPAITLSLAFSRLQASYLAGQPTKDRPGFHFYPPVWSSLLWGFEGGEVEIEEQVNTSKNTEAESANQVSSEASPVKGLMSNSRSQLLSSAVMGLQMLLLSLSPQFIVFSKDPLAASLPPDEVIRSDPFFFSQLRLVEPLLPAVTSSHSNPSSGYRMPFNVEHKSTTILTGDIHSPSTASKETSLAAEQLCRLFFNSALLDKDPQVRQSSRRALFSLQPLVKERFLQIEARLSYSFDKF